MIEYFSEQHPVIQALIATLFTWGVTALGAALVFFVKTVKPRVMDSMLGFAAGVMIAASFWSLLAPGIIVLYCHYQAKFAGTEYLSLRLCGEGEFAGTEYL